MPWTWDPAKDRENLRKHGIGFETAQLVFDDPLALSRLDDGQHEEERWHTVGMVAGVAIVLVVHTAQELGAEGEEAMGRIISARKATRSERRAYEEGDF
jgi:uncharacterized protein